MRLLVSVANAKEAAEALAGGADLVDAKDPASGALGPVSLLRLLQIVSTIAGARPVTAALGDACEVDAIESTARRYAATGVAFVKIGFAGIADPHRAETLTAAAVRGATTGGRGMSGLIATAYADGDTVGSPSPGAIVHVAARSGAVGVLLDTANKQGPGLRDLITPARLAAWVAAAHEEGLLVALAGRLTLDDLAFACDAGADIAGVRGAACDHGRTGHVVADKVRQLTQAVRRSAPAPAPGPRATFG
ncbi:MAG TPA: (5-formylfuran-3-yl)methyl phosphate synthase [Vicinamibacterales bacterium]|nr:(5-formylfuran-3-yl)methyl phosphate synthase [Vicinamibacterales bacterium]